MKTVILTKDELNADLFQDVKFFSVAEGGAMGTAGEIIFLNGNGKSFSLNYFFGDITPDDIVEVFPLLAKCKLGIFGYGRTVPEGWNYVSLGQGNHLVISSDLYDKFKEKTAHIKYEHILYGKWYDIAVNIIENKQGDLL